jgi:hypothetical protein
MPSPPESPVRRSASEPLTRSSTEVRKSSRLTSSGWRSSTSASRYPATVRSLPENSAANPSGSGWLASDSAARRSPAAQPSVRSTNSASAASDSRTLAASNNARASSAPEAQIASTDLGQLAFQAQTMQPNRRSWRVRSANRSSDADHLAVLHAVWTAETTPARDQHYRDLLAAALPPGYHANRVTRTSGCGGPCGPPNSRARTPPFSWPPRSPNGTWPAPATSPPSWTPASASTLAPSSRSRPARGPPRSPPSPTPNAARTSPRSPR